MNPIADLIKGALGPVADVINHVVTSDKDRLDAQRAIFQAESELTGKVLDYEARLVEAQAGIIKAEAASDSWLTKSWRPIVMLIFMGLVVSWWLGYTPPKVSEALVLELFGLIKLGLGGYVIGRSAEKIAPAVVQMVKGAK